MRAWLSGLVQNNIKSERNAFSDEEMLLGVDHETTLFVAELSKWPMTWIEFPLDIVLQDQRLNVAVVAEEKAEKGRAPVPLVLTKKQVRHAELMLERVEGLRNLRLQLCPRVLDEDLFWAIYFLLTKQHLRSLKLDQEIRLSQSEVDVENEAAAGLRVSSKEGKRDWNEVLKENNTRSIYKCILQQGLPAELRRRVLGRLLLSDAPLEPLAELYTRSFGLLVPEEVKTTKARPLSRPSCFVVFSNRWWWCRSLARVRSLLVLLPCAACFARRPCRWDTSSRRSCRACSPSSSKEVPLPLLVSTSCFLSLSLSLGLVESELLDASVRLLRHALDAPVVSAAALSAVLLMVPQNWLLSPFCSERCF
jgi:hypothetical protein